MFRRRKHGIAEAVRDVPVGLFCFELLYADGQDLTRLSYPQRRAALAEAITVSDRLRLTTATEVSTPAALDAAFEQAVTDGCEGLVYKSVSPAASYQAGARGWQWIKLKRDYRTELSDTVDLVVVGAFAGRGRRRGLYGALLLAAYDPAADVFRAVSKCGTGFSDADLAALKYYPGSIDGRFGTNTLEAVWAFQEVQGLLPVHDYVSSAMQWTLAHPRAPKVLVPHGGANRVEISLSREVLVLYHNNQVELISHVSTGGHYYYCSNGGCGYAVTPTGNFRTVVFMPGWIQVPLGEMYNSVFFIGTAFAIHGDTYVPLAPVSHGCVRIPMDIAAFFHKLVYVPGEPVYIRG